MIPAHALAEELLRARPSGGAGHRRSRRAHPRPVRQASRSTSFPPGGSRGGPVGWLRAVAQASSPAGRWRSRLYETFLPSAVIGFGGYPALPGSAGGAARPHPDPDPRAECGARPGQPADGRQGRRDRHRLSERPAAAGQGARTRSIWSAIRSATRCWRCATSPIPALTEDGIFRLLVTGGSQGATILSEVVPEGLGLLPEHFRRRLQVTQQCRAEDIEQVRARYAALGIPADLATYHRRHARAARLVAPRHRPRRRLDHRRADRRRPAGDPGAAADRDRRPPDLQRPRNGQGRRRADDRPDASSPPVELAKQMQKLGLEPAALANAAARAKSGRPARRGERPRRPRRADRPRSRRRSAFRARGTVLRPMPGRRVPA